MTQRIHASDKMWVKYSVGNEFHYGITYASLYNEPDMPKIALYVENIIGEEHNPVDLTTTRDVNFKYIPKKHLLPASEEEVMLKLLER